MNSEPNFAHLDSDVDGIDDSHTDDSSYTAAALDIPAIVRNLSESRNFYNYAAITHKNQKGFHSVEMTNNQTTKSIDFLLSPPMRIAYSPITQRFGDFQQASQVQFKFPKLRLDQAKRMLALVGTGTPESLAFSNFVLNTVRDFMAQFKQTPAYAEFSNQILANDKAGDYKRMDPAAKDEAIEKLIIKEYGVFPINKEYLTKIRIIDEKGNSVLTYPYLEDDRHFPIKFEQKILRMFKRVDSHGAPVQFPALPANADMFQAQLYQNNMLFKELSIIDSNSDEYKRGPNGSYVPLAKGFTVVVRFSPRVFVNIATTAFVQKVMFRLHFEMDQIQVLDNDTTCAEPDLTSIPPQHGVKVCELEAPRSCADEENPERILDLVIGRVRKQLPPRRQLHAPSPLGGISTNTSSSSSSSGSASVIENPLVIHPVSPVHKRKERDEEKAESRDVDEEKTNESQTKKKKKSKH
jgi:hypothetical protein